MQVVERSPTPPAKMLDQSVNIQHDGNLNPCQYYSCFMNRKEFSVHLSGSGLYCRWRQWRRPRKTGTLETHSAIFMALADVLLLILRSICSEHSSVWFLKNYLVCIMLVKIRPQFRGKSTVKYIFRGNVRRLLSLEAAWIWMVLLQSKQRINFKWCYVCFELNML